jgi:diadenosine tetraphosphate (Ap4A) HIT family hydrolase
MDTSLSAPMNFDIADELTSRRMPKFFQGRLGRAKRILAETDALTMLPTVSPLTVGHVLVFSKSADMSFADALQSNATIKPQLSFLQEEYEARFGAAICFEHGSSGRSQTACGVSRAHLHLLPAASVCIDNLRVELRNDLGDPLFVSLEEYASKLAQQEYVTVGTLASGFAAWAIKDIPSQIVRRSIARQLHLPHWDWKNLFGWDVVSQTIDIWERQTSCRAA